MRAPVQHMRIDHRRADVAVAQQLLDGAECGWRTHGFRGSSEDLVASSNVGAVDISGIDSRTRTTERAIHESAPPRSLRTLRIPNGAHAPQRFARSRRSSPTSCPLRGTEVLRKPESVRVSGDQEFVSVCAPRRPSGAVRTLGREPRGRYARISTIGSPVSPSAAPNVGSGLPMACSTVNGTRLVLSPAARWWMSPRNNPPALPISSIGKSSMR
jgi:hypothetical protein